MEPLTMIGAQACHLDITRVSVALAGEFDAHELESLRQVLDALLSLRGEACVDLTGVPFLALRCARVDLLRFRGLLETW
jgi:hypothetical protein